MKIKLDENIPRRVEPLLRANGHDVDTVHGEGRVGQPDTTVVQAAIDAGRMLITLDRGFPAPAVLPEGHPGVIVLRLRNQGVPSVVDALTSLLDHYDLESLHSCVVIVAPGRIRVRRPRR